ncbi:hypothetical protein IW262DRAFT_1295556 [Armillaria fumosa]|nr:hypothetical protein IW262DRAFT_1295556 [Armillaria fumosa]
MFHQSLATLVQHSVGSRISYTCITATINAGVARRTTGSRMRNFPHQYRNFEGLNMQCAGPPYNEVINNSFSNHCQLDGALTIDEYPILPGDLYASGRPGADRVVFNNSGDY